MGNKKKRKEVVFTLQNKGIPNTQHFKPILMRVVFTLQMIIHEFL